MTRSNVEDLYPLSPLQEGMLFDTLNAPGSGVYVTQSHCELFGDVDPELVREAWRRTMERHTVLRTAFLWKRRKILQAVLHQVRLPWSQDDWRGLSREQQKIRFREILETDRERGFDVAKAPLMRLRLIRTAQDAWQLYWCYHHLVLDGWSADLVLAEVSVIFDALSKGQKPSLGQSLPYRDFISWLRQQDAEEAKRFWRHLLVGFQEPTPLPSDRRRGVGTAARRHDGPDRHEKLTATVPQTATAELEAWVRHHHLTLSVVVQGIWGLLLSHFSGRSEVLFGLVVSGRPASLEDYDSRVGMFVNTVPVRLHLVKAQPLMAWLQAHQEQQGEMRSYEHVSLADIRRWGGLPQSGPLFDSLVGIDNYPRFRAALGGAGENASTLQVRNPGGHDQTSVPLTLAVWPSKELALELDGSAAWFSEAMLQRILKICLTMLTVLPTKSECSLGELQRLIAETLREETLEAVRHSEAAARKELLTTRPMRQRVRRRKLLRRSLLEEGGTPLPKLTPEVEDMDLAGWAESKKDLLTSWLERYGLLLFRGFDLRSDQKRKRLDAVLCGSTNATPQRWLSAGGCSPLHNRGASAGSWPQRLRFLCTTAPEDGELVFADTRRVLHHLDPALRRRCEIHGLLYGEVFPAEGPTGWREVFDASEAAAVESLCQERAMVAEWGPEGGLTTIRARPAILPHPTTGEPLWFSEITHWYEPGQEAALADGGGQMRRRHCRLGDGSEIDPEAFRRICHAYSAAEAHLAWEAGDLLVVDNMLIACGHPAIAGHLSLELITGGEVTLSAMEETPA